jgi:hypothetical protein
MYTAEDISSMSTMAAFVCAQLKGHANRWATGMNDRRSLTFFISKELKLGRGLDTVGANCHHHMYREIVYSASSSSCTVYILPAFDKVNSSLMIEVSACSFHFYYILVLLKLFYINIHK